MEGSDVRIRESGVWTTYRDVPRMVAGRVDLDVVELRATEQGLPRETAAAAELGEIVRVRTVATWRDGRIDVAGVSPEGVRFYTRDRELAQREGLRGDWHEGWGGVAPVAELRDVEESTTVLREANGGAVR